MPVIFERLIYLMVNHQPESQKGVHPQPPSPFSDSMIPTLEDEARGAMGGGRMPTTA